jgi:hypothetical protein
MTEYEGGGAKAGAGELANDSKIGNSVNALVTVVGLAVVSWLGDLDFSTFPKAIATLAPPAIGLISGLITSKFLPRYGRRS